MKKDDKITTAQICAALQRHYVQPRYAILFEVASNTGVGSPRTADALVMSCWPSMGLELHGIEIKASRYDWQKERKQPEKAERIAAYCDRWSLVAAPGVVHDISEVPQAWGLIEFNGKKLKTLREAAKNEKPEPIDRLFLAAMMRRAAKTNEAMMEAELSARLESGQASLEQTISDRVAKRTEKYETLHKAVKDFEEKTGIKLIEHESYHYLSTVSGRKIGALVSMLSKGGNGLYSTWGGGLSSLIKSLEETIKQVSKVKAELGLDEVERATEEERDEFRLVAGGRRR